MPDELTREQVMRSILERERWDARKNAKLIAKAPSFSSLIDHRGSAEYSDNWTAPTRYVQEHIPTRPLEEVARFNPLSPTHRAPILPTLFMPGFPKSATSWLYGCLLHAFSPEAVGCGRHAHRWGADKCPHRFAMTALYSTARGEFREKKELFYFGGIKGDEQFRFRHDLMDLHGPDPTVPHLPPLWPWDYRIGTMVSKREMLHAMCSKSVHSQSCLLERRDKNCTAATCSEPCALPPRCSNLGTAACEDPHWAKFRFRCKAQGSNKPLPSSGCYHPACVRTAPASPQFSGQFLKCAWDRAFAFQGRGAITKEAYCVHSLLPWAKKDELNVSVVDFTPNYICDADAMRRLHEGAAGQRGRLRFIVVMRDPIMRAFSEWAMFSLGWNWDPVKNFSASMAFKIRDLKECNETLFNRPDLLRHLPTEEVAQYMRSCFRYGAATMYPTTSMYSVCMLHALRYFRRDQFLVLRYADLMRWRLDARLMLG
jgi:hypothetical protein